MAEMLSEVAAPGSAAEVVVASHNQASIQAAAARMALLGLHPSTSPVFFGQLYGMADHLTYTLASAGYKVPLPDGCAHTQAPLPHTPQH